MTPFTTRPTLSGSFGMVSSTHWLASQAAMRMLELGGNAFDAAVAGGFVLHVVEPHLNGPGGDLPAIVATAADPRPQVLCGQGPAPAAATPEAFARMGLDHVPGSGPVASAVPGAVDAWLLLLRDHGSLPLATVLEPAIGYARDGHPLLPRVAATIERVRELFERDWPTSAEVWLPGGEVPVAGELFANPAYAAVLQRLADVATAAGDEVAVQAQAARREWGEGFVAEAVEAFADREFPAADGRLLPGLVRGSDLAAYSATWEPAAVMEWHGVQVAKTGLWGQGPALLQVLAVLDRLAETHGPDVLDPDTELGMHAVVEAWKLAMADREAWFGEAAPVTVAQLLDPAYVAERAALVGTRAEAGLRPGSPGGLEPRLAEHVRRLLAGEATDRAADVTTGEPTVERDGTTRGDTCHLDVVDRWGNMISATPSGGWLQSSPTIPELGFCLGSRSQMFWLDEGLPASLAPGARPRTTLTPTLVLRDGVPVLACGSPGGDQQDQWQSLFLLRHVVGGRELQEAIDAPMFHTDGFPGSFHPRTMAPASLSVEDRVDPATLEALERRGHVVTREGPWSLGRMCAVARDPRTGLLTAAANPRGMQGYAVGR
ncbi:gamma-glutamyltransferase family protein [Nocardioides aurantiacus]|uniref:Gamma-glutamyltranspeptidase/glutathione hydrolase n=1 Tax=Nocardioides aurantiacus TaxID=86796 RepID=A0A3N2CUW0_9ACTN|nr:gamma-glutamyltranspeptidase/glutathione hydrolase [Nocardioides aurantiacus]